MKRLIVCLVMLGFSHWLLAQGFLKATVSTDKVELGESFEYTLIAKDIQGRLVDIDLNSDVLEVLSGPSMSSRTSIINGSVSSTIEYSFELRARKIGTVQIPPAFFKTNTGKTMTTDPVEVQVLKATNSKALTLKDLNQELGQDVFLKLHLPEGPYYTGQQILADLTIYTAVQVRSYVTVKTNFTLPGCTIIPLRNYRPAAKEVTLDGKKYVTKVLGRYAIFPVQMGTYEIEPLSYRVSIIAGNRPKTLSISSDPEAFDVISIPNMPNDFCGAVGDFSMKAKLRMPSTLSTDDAFNIVLRLSGNGDMDQIVAPVLDFGDTFKIYPPEILNEDRYESGGQISFDRTYGYQITPSVAGDYSIIPKVAFFNPDSSTFLLLQTDTFEIKVLQGENKKSEILASNDTYEELTLSQPLPLGTLKQKTNTSFLLSKKPWLVFTVPILCMLGMFALRKYKDSRPEIDLKAERFNAAEKMVQQKLQKAKVQMDAKNVRGFYDELIHAIYQYLSDKCHIPLADLDKKKIETYLHQQNIAPSTTEKLLQLLHSCELGLFAGLSQTDKLPESMESATSVFLELEKHFKKKVS